MMMSCGDGEVRNWVEVEGWERAYWHVAGLFCARSLAMVIS
jgi:hypothetical protein